MELRIPALALTCSALAVVMVGPGCTSSSSQQQRAADARDAEVRFVLGPLVDEDGARRSLALDSAAMNELYDYQPWLTQQASWYDTRLDDRPGVNAGSRRVILSVSETTVRDKISSSNGKVQDNYSQSTTRDQVIQIVR
ncbi:MAG: hypothetical protein AAF086_06045 [Planctomycetota bacterium]